jgi:hypothetical protein
VREVVGGEVGALLAEMLRGKGDELGEVALVSADGMGGRVQMTISAPPALEISKRAEICPLRSGFFFGAVGRPGESQVPIEPDGEEVGHSAGAQ